MKKLFCIFLSCVLFIFVSCTSLRSTGEGYIYGPSEIVVDLNMDVPGDSYTTWGKTYTVESYGAGFKGFTDGENLFVPGETILVYGVAHLTGVWEKVTVKYDYGYDNITKEIEIPKGRNSFSPEVPKREGFDFKGWESDGKFYYPGKEIELTESIVLTAVWREIPKVKISLDYGFDDKIEEIEIPKGSDFIFPEPPDRAGYVFEGWKLSKVYQPGEIMKNVSWGFGVDAIWALENYTITFISEGMEEKIDWVYYGEDYTFKKIDRDGYILKGWTDGQNTYKEGDTIKITGNLVLEGIWEKTKTKIELYTDWINQKKAIASVGIIELMKSDCFNLSFGGLNIIRLGDKIKILTNDGFTAYFDGSDTYIVTRDSVIDYAFRLAVPGSYNEIESFIDIFLNLNFCSLLQGKFRESGITDDMEYYYEVFGSGSSSLTFYFYRNEFISFKKDDGYHRSFSLHDDVTEDDVSLSDNSYKILESSDLNMFGISKIFGRFLQ